MIVFVVMDGVDADVFSVHSTRELAEQAIEIYKLTHKEVWTREFGVWEMTIDEIKKAAN